MSQELKFLLTQETKRAEKGACLGARTGPHLMDKLALWELGWELGCVIRLEEGLPFSLCARSFYSLCGSILVR